MSVAIVVLCLFQTAIIIFDNFHVYNGKSRDRGVVLFAQLHYDDFNLFEDS